MIATFCRNLRVSFLLLFYLKLFCVESLSVTPTTSLVVAGGELLLRCQSSPMWVTWTVHYLHGESCILASGASLQQCASRGRMSVSQEGYGRQSSYILRVQPVLLSDAGSYVCSYGHENVQASLTVLGSVPSGDWSPKSIMAGDELALTCRVSYHGSFTPRATWTNNAGVSVSKGVTSQVAGSTNGTLVFLESTLTVPVAVGTVLVEPFTCTIGLSVPTQSSTLLTWRSTSIIVSYCPQNLAIMSSDDVITIGTELTCVSNAHPAPAYRWVILTGSGFVSGSDNRTLTVTSQDSDGNYHFLCTAYNYLRGTGGNPCFASVEVQEYVVGVQENTEEPIDVGKPSTPKTATVPESGSSAEERHDRTARSQHSTSLPFTEPYISSNISSPLMVSNSFPPRPTTRTVSMTSSSTTVRSTTYTSSHVGSITDTVQHLDSVSSPRPIEASYTSWDAQQQLLSGYKTAIVVLSVFVCLIVLALVIMGFILARIARQLPRDQHAGALYQTVAWRGSAKSVTTEMSSLTVGDHMNTM